MSEYFDTGTLTSWYQSRMAADTDATGLRVGATTHLDCVSGISLFGSVAGSVLVQKSTRTFATISSGSVTSPETDVDSSWDGLPILETSAGLAWVYDCLSIRAGYELATWFNVTEVGLVLPSGRPNETRYLTLDGVFVQLEILL